MCIHIYIYIQYIYIYIPNYMRSTHDGGVKMAAVHPAILPVISPFFCWHRLQRQDDGPEQAVSPTGPVHRGLESSGRGLMGIEEIVSEGD